MADGDTPRQRPLVAEPRPGGTDLLDREPLPDADDRSLPDAGRADRHGAPDASRLAFQRPSEGPRHPDGLTDRARRLWSRIGTVPTRQLTIAVLVTLAGVGLLLGWAVHVSWTPLIDVALIVLGAALVVQARRTTVSRPLIGLGVFLALIATATWRADVTLDGGLGRRTVAPVSATVIHRQLGTGQLTIDLTKLQGNGPVRVNADVGVGRIVVKVPKADFVLTRSVAGTGLVVVAGHDHVGPGLDEARNIGRRGGRVVQLDLHVGVGSVEVPRV
jgi:hypothetical protein